MTPEQLDEIEKRWDGYLEKNEVERRFLFDQWWDKRDFWDMTKALREAWEERDKYKAALDAELPAAWREDIESLNSCLERIGKERDEARAEVERLRVERDEARRLHSEHTKRSAALAEARRKDFVSMECELEGATLELNRIRSVTANNDAWVEKGMQQLTEMNEILGYPDDEIVERVRELVKASKPEEGSDDDI